MTKSQCRVTVTCEGSGEKTELSPKSGGSSTKNLICTTIWGVAPWNLLGMIFRHSTKIKKIWDFFSMTFFLKIFRWHFWKPQNFRKSWFFLQKVTFFNVKTNEKSDFLESFRKFWVFQKCHRKIFKKKVIEKKTNIFLFLYYV